MLCYIRLAIPRVLLGFPILFLRLQLAVWKLEFLWRSNKGYFKTGVNCLSQQLLALRMCKKVFRTLEVILKHSVQLKSQKVRTPSVFKATPASDSDLFNLFQARKSQAKIKAGFGVGA